MTTSPTIFSNLHASQNWKTDTNSGIGPTPPKTFAVSYVQIPPPPQPPPTTRMVISIAGILGSWCDGMAQLTLTTPPGITNYRLIYSFIPPVGFVSLSSAFEIGFRSTDENGYTTNGQIQADFIALRSKGQMQIDTVPAGQQGWASTGIIQPAYVEGVEHTIVQTYKRDPVKNTFSPLTWGLDGQVFNIPTSLQNIPSIKMEWTPNSLVIGIQTDVNNLGGAYQVETTDLNLQVW